MVGEWWLSFFLFHCSSPGGRLSITSCVTLVSDLYEALNIGFRILLFRKKYFSATFRRWFRRDRLWPNTRGRVDLSLGLPCRCGNQNSHRRLEESQEILTFREVSDSLQEPTTNDRINAENMKRQQNKFMEKVYIYFESAKERCDYYKRL